MELNNKEKKFCDIVYKYRKYYEKVYIESLKYQIDVQVDNIKKPISKVKVHGPNGNFTTDFILLGLSNKNTFIWRNSINKIFYDQIKKYNWITNGYVSKKFLDYFFTKNRFELLAKYKDLIIYIISITNPNYNLIKFTSENNISIYALVKLGIQDKFEYKKEFEQKFI